MANPDSSFGLRTRERYTPRHSSVVGRHRPPSGKHTPQHAAPVRFGFLGVLFNIRGGGGRHTVTPTDPYKSAHPFFRPEERYTEAT